MGTEATVTQADEAAAISAWNGIADELNQWGNLSEAERVHWLEAFARHREAHCTAASQASDAGEDENYRECVEAAVAPAVEWYAKGRSAKDITIYLINNMVADLRVFHARPTQGGELAAELRPLWEAVTAGDLSTAERHIESELVECPMCHEGSIEAADYCNIDGKALGVQFYGIGPEHGAHERLWTAVIANFPTILATLTAPPTSDAGEVITNGQYEDDDFSPAADIARNIASYCDGDARKNVYRAAKRALATLSPPTSGEEMRLREVLPRLDDGLIEAALLAHYGKWASNLGINGVDLTANDTNWTFRDGFKRMWAGVRRELNRRAGLNAGQPENAP